MFLADAVAAYVEALTERELDAPLIALMHRLGFSHVHLVHGPFEVRQGHHRPPSRRRHRASVLPADEGRRPGVGGLAERPPAS